MARWRSPGKIDDEKLRNRPPGQNFLVTTIYHIIAWVAAIGGAIILYRLYRIIMNAWK
jgi:uncharacterized membrane protein